MSRVLAAVAAVVLATSLLVSPAVAQRQGDSAPAPSPVGGGIALLDVSAIFKNHEGFKARMADLQRDAARAEENFKKERDAIRALGEQLRELKAGTLEYRQLEEQVAKRTSDLNVQVQLQRKEFLQQEAKHYYQVYQEIQQEVAYFAANNNIAMVLRFTGEPVDVEKPDDVLRDLNKQVIWFSKGLDITPLILQNLAARGGYNRPVHPGPAQRPGIPAPR